MLLERAVVELVLNSTRPTENVRKGESIAKVRFNFFLSINIIGRAKRAPHWGVQSRFRVIYVCWYVSYSGCRFRSNNGCVLR